jgi:hypothetical protein
MSYPAWFNNAKTHASTVFQDDIEMTISECGKWVKVYDNCALITYNPNKGTFSGLKVLNISIREFLTHFVVNDPNHAKFEFIVRKFLQNP